MELAHSAEQPDHLTPRHDVKAGESTIGSGEMRNEREIVISPLHLARDCLLS
jgi:hypothetical protein